MWLMTAYKETEWLLFLTGFRKKLIHFWKVQVITQITEVIEGEGRFRVDMGFA
jgi:hypothetical protein